MPEKKFHVFQLCASLCYLSLPAICVCLPTRHSSARCVFLATDVLGSEKKNFFFEDCSVPVPTTPKKKKKTWTPEKRCDDINSSAAPCAKRRCGELFSSSISLLHSRDKRKTKRKKKEDRIRSGHCVFVVGCVKKKNFGVFVVFLFFPDC